MPGGALIRGLAVLAFLTCLQGAATVRAGDALTTHEAMDISPSWSPDGGAVSFCSDRDGQGNIWIASAAGGDARRVTEGLGSVYDAAWSPDGSRIAYAAAGGDGNYDIWTVAVEGGTIERITTHEAVDDSPAWCPDGRALLFQSDRGGNIDIWRIDLESGELTRITTDPGYDHAPACSCGDGTIAFFSDRSGNWDVWTIPAAGGEATRITETPANDTYPCWSPDGAFIAFQSDRGGNMDVWAIPAAGGTASRLTDHRGHDSRPCWSPDGSKIAVCSDRAGNLDIWVLDLLSPSCERSLISEAGSLLPRPVGILSSRIEALMHAAAIPGLSIAVIRNGRIYWEKGFGIRSSEGTDPVGKETLFEATALSEPVLAYAVLRLADRGEIDLDRPLERYLPYGRIGHDDRSGRITARMVLAHSSGLSSPGPDDPLSIAFEPGERFLLSGEGMIYLGMVVESICGLSLEQLIDREVFRPLGMERSTFAAGDTPAASGHDWKGDAVRTSSDASSGRSSRGAVRGLLTSAGDYARFLIAVMNGEGLLADSAAAMLTPQIPVEGDASWGLGFGLAKSAGDDLFWHFGDNGAFQAYAVAYRNARGGVVYFANSANGLAIVEKLVSSVTGESHPFLSWLDYPDCSAGPVKLRSLIARAWQERGAAGVVEEMKRLQSASPDMVDSETANSVGRFVLEADRYGEAKDIYRIATALFPESSDAFEGFARACAGSGEEEEAIDHLKKCLELDPGNRRAGEMLEALQADQAR